MAPYSMAGLLSCASERVFAAWSESYHPRRRPAASSYLCHMPPETLGQDGDLQGLADAHRCRVKSLIASALVGFGVRQHSRAESISKRARSTTPTSLRFKINSLRAVWTV